MRAIEFLRKDNISSGVELGRTEKKLVLFADDTTFFLRDDNSLKSLLSILDQFGSFSSLKINLEKSEAGWIDSVLAEKKS
jgi:hypothetical protein